MNPFFQNYVLFVQVTQWARNIPLVSIVWLTWSNCLSTMEPLESPSREMDKKKTETTEKLLAKHGQTTENSRVGVFFWHPFKKDYAQVKLDHFPNDGG